MTQRKGIKNRQCNDPKKRDKEQTTIYKTLYRKLNDHGTRTSLKFYGELVCSGSVSSSFDTSDTSGVTIVTNPV